MIDLHVHTTISDGCCLPAEAAQRAKAAGCRAIVLADHADQTSLPTVVAATKAAARDALHAEIDVYPGVELTHVPPALMAETVARARELGAVVVVVHGETLMEPIPRGVNLAAIEAGVDVLAHPGLLTPQEAALAAERDVCLELSTKPLHSLTNGLVARLAQAHGARLVVNTDAHTHDHYYPAAFRKAVALGAGLSAAEVQATQVNAERVLQRALTRLRA